MKTAGIIVKASEIVPTLNALKELGETPHLPVDLFPNVLLLSQKHHIFIEVPFLVRRVFTANLPVRPDERQALLVLTEQVLRLLVCEELVTHRTVV